MLSQIGFLALFAGSLLSHPAQASPLLPLATIPDYVIAYAPLSHLYSKEQWFHSDVATHLEHTTPQVRVSQSTSCYRSHVGSV